jgi:serine/threonine protein phosphatase PrpC
MTAGIAWPYYMLGLAAALLAILFAVRERTAAASVSPDIGSAQTIGRREVQADASLVSASKTGYIMVMADGMGAEDLSVRIAEIACQAIEEQYSYYADRMNTALFFRSAMTIADKRVKNYLSGERGGVSLAIALITGERLYYALCGNARIYVLRKGELVSLCEPHIMRKFAETAYFAGRIDKETALSHLNDKRVYRYIGCEDFEPGEEELPVRLKVGDCVALMTDGVCISQRELVSALSGRDTARKLARKIISVCEAMNCEDNASVTVAKM